MRPPSAHGLLPEITQRPITVLLHGSSRPLLNWVMFTLLDRSHPNFWWTDLRVHGETLDPLDPLARHVVPEDHLSIVEPHVLQRSPDPTRAFSTMIQAGEPTESVQRALDFLRLPSHTQDLISRGQPTSRPAQFGLSNGHRLVGLFPTGTIQPTLQAILDSKVSLVMTWADALPASARLYDFVLGVEGAGPAVWKDAVLHCEIGNSAGPVRAGQRLRLGELRPVAEILEPMELSRT